MTYERLICLIVPVTLGTLLLNRLIVLFLRNKHLEEKIKSLEKYQKEQRQYYKAVIEKYEGLRSFQHDFKNHMHVIAVMLQEGRYEEAKGYLDKIINIHAQISFRDLGNSIVNCLWAQYFSEWEERQELQVFIIGRFPKSMPMEDMDVCALFGNVFSNAAEAMKDLPDRRMDIEVKHTRQELCIWIKNSIENTYIDVEESTKKEKQKHGIGIKNMKMAVKRYGGDISWEIEENKMVVSIFLQLVRKRL